MRNRSVISEGRQIQLATELIDLGARLQLLETETTLSRERLLRLYKEVRGKSPSKGMLPFSADWFLKWQPNVHSSLFVGIHRYLTNHGGQHGIQALIKAYRLYLEHVQCSGLEPILTVTRAWTLLRFLDVLLRSVECKRCSGHFIVHRLDVHSDYVCGLCRPPSRAGKPGRRSDAMGAQGYVH